MATAEEAPFDYSKCALVPFDYSIASATARSMDERIFEVASHRVTIEQAFKEDGKVPLTLTHTLHALTTHCTLTPFTHTHFTHTPLRALTTRTTARSHYTLTAPSHHPHSHITLTHHTMYSRHTHTMYSRHTHTSHNALTSHSHITQCTHAHTRWSQRTLSHSHHSLHSTVQGSTALCRWMTGGGQGGTDIGFGANVYNSSFVLSAYLAEHLTDKYANSSLTLAHSLTYTSCSGKAFCCVFLFTLSQLHTHIHSPSLALVVMMKLKELKTKNYSHAHSLIHTHSHAQSHAHSFAHSFFRALAVLSCLLRSHHLLSFTHIHSHSLTFTHICSPTARRLLVWHHCPLCCLFFAASMVEVWCVLLEYG